jgi:hypothetical protein
MADHFNQKPRRNAEFIKAPNIMKVKVGHGGLEENLLAKAQNLLENNTMDFGPLAEMYLTSLIAATEKAKAIIGFDGDHEVAIVGLLYPIMQLKANGGMFHYPLITILADKQVQFLEVIAKIDRDIVDLVNAFTTTIRAVLASQIKDQNNVQGRELVLALDDACRRYFSKHPYNRNPL